MLFSAVLICATAATALSIPDPLNKRQTPNLVDLNIFQGHTFPLLDQATAAAQVSAKNAKFNPALVPASEQFSVQAAQATCTNPSVHVEWRNLSQQQRLAFVNAIKCLQGKPSKLGAPARNALDDLTYTHQQQVNTIHLVGKFLPWHRYFVYVFETLLREQCSYTGPMTWWDETKDAGRFSSAVVFDSTTFGSAPRKTSSGQGTCITNGVFANTILNVGPGVSNTAHCLSRAVDETLTAQVTTGFVNLCNSMANYTDMQDCSYRGSHAYGHDGTGAVMSDVATSPGDPIFFLHHAFVDRNWLVWQNADPTNRRFQVSGPLTQSGSGTTTLDTPIAVSNIKPNIVVRDVMDTQGSLLCYTYDY